MTRPVTVITITTSPLDDDEPLTDKAMRSVESVQNQTLPPDQWDLLVMQDVGDFTVHDLHRMGAEQAKTEWLVFLPEGDTLPPHALAEALGFHETNVDRVVGNGCTLVRREAYLKEQS